MKEAQTRPAAGSSTLIVDDVVVDFATKQHGPALWTAEGVVRTAPFGGSSLDVHPKVVAAGETEPESIAALQRSIRYWLLEAAFATDWA